VRCRERRALEVLLRTICLSENPIEATTQLLSVTHSGTDEHREQLCLADDKNVRQSPIMGGNQGVGVFEWKEEET